MSTAIVVGAGPNGLAAAVRLAERGVGVRVLEAADVIGGGTRTSELTVPGLLHDDCSAFHPLVPGTPYLPTLDLGRYGLRWRWPEIDCAHPLDSGAAGLLWRSIDRTADGLGSDGRAWRRVFGRAAAGIDDIVEDVMRPVLHVPRHPLRLARFGPQALLPAAALAKSFRTEEARALFGGVAAHAFHPLNRPATSATAMVIIAAGHQHGWPVAEGGSRAISDALAAMLGDLGGKITTGVRVASSDDLPPADVVMFDLAPGAVASILGDRLPSRVARAYRRYRHGSAAFKVDLAVDGGVPWTNPDCGRAGTVHLGGTFDEIAANERDTYAGRMPDRPFMLVGQQYLADPTRSVGDIHPVWVYAHVPHAFTGDATEAILAQLERFAPGVRDRIVATAVRSTTELSRHNPNFVGGDIATGAADVRQLLFRPRISANPYATGVPGVYICSAATPPGAGAHGMCGFNAANQALDELGISGGG